MKKKYIDISLIQYLNSSDEIKDEYDIALLYSDHATKPRDALGVGSLSSRSFGEVKDIQTLYTHGMGLKEYVDTMVDLAGKEIKEVVSLSVFDFFAQKYYIDAEINRIFELEAKNLSYDPSIEEEAAGLERFNKFGVALQLDSLAGGDVTKWDEVRALPYEIALLKLIMDKTKNDYQKDLNDIMNAKRKT